MGEYVFNKENLRDYVIYKFAENNNGELITPIKLQKGLYFLFAIWGGQIKAGKNNPEEIEEDVSNYHDKLFNADFYAWRYGPVDIDVFHWFKENKDSINLSKVRELRRNDDISKEEYDLASTFVDSILSKVFNTNDFALVDLSHKDKCWKDARALGGSHIDNNCIINEYASEARN